MLLGMLYKNKLAKLSIRVVKTFIQLVAISRYLRDAKKNPELCSAIRESVRMIRMRRK